MGSSRRKASFRIDDILSGSSEQNGGPPTSVNSSIDKPVISERLQPSSSTSTSTSTNQSQHSLLKSSLSSNMPYDLSRDAPRRPAALYPAGMHLQKPPMFDRPLCLPMSLPLPVTPFHSYLDHYASAAFNKAPARYWSFYPHAPGYGGFFRPFNGSPCGSKRKGGQVRFTPQQTQNLERRFASHKYLSPEDRRLLAGQLKLSDRQVKTWFQNRRAKWRRANNITSPEGHDGADSRSEDDATPPITDIDQDMRSDDERSQSPITVT